MGMAVLVTVIVCMNVANHDAPTAVAPRCHRGGGGCHRPLSYPYSCTNAIAIQRQYKRSRSPSSED